MESLAFLTEDQVRRIQAEFGTPVFVYDARTLERRAREVLAFPNAFGLTARFAMKSLPNAAVLQLFHRVGLHIDASSGFEAERALRAGIPATHIQITAQELPKDLEGLVRRGCTFNACSLRQLEVYGRLFPGTDVSVRVNPGLGSGHSNRTNVGGPSASFGIWHEHLDEALALAAGLGVRVTGMHTHIGSGSDPEMWVHCAGMSLAIAARLPEVTRLSLGGGYKIARMSTEKEANLQCIGGRMAAQFEAFAHETGRRLHLEVEPGTYLVANAGALICTVLDVVDTGAAGNVFVKIDGGMTENTRPSLYGAQHPLVVVPQTADAARGEGDYLVVGHCCESGDIFTPEPDNPEGLGPRRLTRPEPGDALVMEATGAYCSSMSTKNYNSFPECAEVLLQTDGAPQLIRRRQTLDQILQNEL
jgi:diaminopimelate decarboxylase